MCFWFKALIVAYRYSCWIDDFLIFRLQPGQDPVAFFTNLYLASSSDGSPEVGDPGDPLERPIAAVVVVAVAVAVVVDDAASTSISISSSMSPNMDMVGDVEDGPMLFAFSLPLPLIELDPLVRRLLLPLTAILYMKM